MTTKTKNRPIWQSDRVSSHLPTKGAIALPGGWNLYDIHHIKPREYGGTNDFDNLVPVLRQVHIDEFNAFWRDW